MLVQFADVKLIVTNSAKYFINEADLPAEVLPILGVGRLVRHEMLEMPYRLGLCESVSDSTFAEI